MDDEAERKKRFIQIANSWSASLADSDDVSMFEVSTRIQEAIETELDALSVNIEAYIGRVLDESIEEIFKKHISFISNVYITKNGDKQIQIKVVQGFGSDDRFECAQDLYDMLSPDGERSEEEINTYIKVFERLLSEWKSAEPFHDE